MSRLIETFLVVWVMCGFVALGMSNSCPQQHDRFLKLAEGEVKSGNLSKEGVDAKTFYILAHLAFGPIVLGKNITAVMQHQCQ